MAHVITGACVGHTHRRCVPVCPVDAIQGEPGVDPMVFIDREVCIDCFGCAPECPVGAIYAESDLPTPLARWSDVNRLWFADREAGRTTALAYAGEDAADATATDASASAD